MQRQGHLWQSTFGQSSQHVLAPAVVLNFYAPWCPWCQRLEPTWEAVTQEVHSKYPDSDGRLRFAKVQHYSGISDALSGSRWI